LASRIMFDPLAGSVTVIYPATAGPFRRDPALDAPPPALVSLLGATRAAALVTLVRTPALTTGRLARGGTVRIRRCRLPTRYRPTRLRPHRHHPQRPDSPPHPDPARHRPGTRLNHPATSLSADHPSARPRAAAPGTAVHPQRARPLERRVPRRGARWRHLRGLGRGA
jgi:hypothetical protein